MEDGIYFNIREDDYHAINRLSSSGISNMLKSPADFWAKSWLNPDCKNTSTLANQVGSAQHTALFEPQLLDMKYCRGLDFDDYPEILTSGTEIGNQLADMGYPKKQAGEDVIAQAQRLQEAGYLGPIKHLVEIEFNEATSGRVIIPSKNWDAMQKDVANALNNEAVYECVKDGAAEVTILWTDDRTGIKMKCRIDKLKSDRMVDLKTFENTKGKNVRQCIIDAFQYNHSYIQGVLYWQAIELIRAGKLTAPETDLNAQNFDLIEAIKAREEPLAIYYIYMQKSGVPNIFINEYKLFTKPHASHEHSQVGASETAEQAVAKMTVKPSSIHLKAETEIQHAQNEYNYYLETYGDKPWYPINPHGVIDDESFNPFWLEN